MDKAGDSALLKLKCLGSEYQERRSLVKKGDFKILARKVETTCTVETFNRQRKGGKAI